MSALIRVFLDLALLRSGPQVLPASSLLLACAAFACLASTGLVVALLVGDLAGWARETVGDVLLDAVGLWLVLAIARRTARYPQTLCAVYGTGVILNLALLPGVLIAVAGGDRFKPFAALLGTLVLGWGMAILANILRHALEIALGWALALAALYTFVSLLVFRWYGAPA